MKQSAPLRLEDQELVNSYLIPLRESQGLFFSPFSFAENYLFREKYHPLLYKQTPLFLSGSFKGNSPFLIPMLPPEEFLKAYNEDKEWREFAIYPVPDEWLFAFPTAEFKAFIVEDYEDYLVERQTLATLKGRHLSAKRNLIHQLESGYSLRLAQLNKELKKEALFVLDTWQEACGMSKEETDYFPCAEALELIDALSLKGQLLYANEKPVGFIIGEILNSRFASFHFVKHLKEVKGVVPFLYRAFATSLPDSIEWINLEEDLGKKSLGTSKHRYGAATKQKWMLQPIETQLAP